MPTRKSLRARNKVTAKQRSDETKTAKARKSYVKRQRLTEMGSSGTAGHFKKGSEDHERLVKRAAAAKKRASQAKKSTGPRKKK